MLNPSAIGHNQDNSTEKKLLNIAEAYPLQKISLLFTSETLLQSILNEVFLFSKLLYPNRDFSL
jgi:hypothetical protein